MIAGLIKKLLKGGGVAELSMDWATQQIQSHAFVGEDSLMEYALTSVAGTQQCQWVLAPHADDEVFGLGGAMALMAKAGHQVKVSVLTNGAARAELGEENQKAATRQAESRRAGEVLGITGYEFYAFSDRRLCGELGLLEVLTRGLKACRPSCVYVTSPWEVHPDHRALAQAVLLTWVETWFQTSELPEWDIWFYEVGAALWPNTLVDITSVAGKKFEAMQCFDSELKFQRYDRYVQALNTYRAYPLGGVQSEVPIAQVEAFFSVKKLVSGSWFQSQLVLNPQPSRDELLKLLQVGLLSNSGQLGLDLRMLTAGQKTPPEGG